MTLQQRSLRTESQARRYQNAEPPIEKGIFGWMPLLVLTKEQDMVNEVGLDGAMFIRFTKILRNIFACLTVVGGDILLPVNLVSSNNSAKTASFFLKMTSQYMYGRYLIARTSNGASTPERSC